MRDESSHDSRRHARVAPNSLTLNEFVVEEYGPLQESLAHAGRRSWRGVELYRDRYERHIASGIGTLPIESIEGRDVAALLRDMRSEGYAEATIAQALVVLRAMFRLARSRRVVSSSPVDELDPSEKPRPTGGVTGRILDENELAALCSHTSEGYRPVVTVLAYTGLRLSEALGLRWMDIDFTERELHVRGQLQRLSGRGEPRFVAPKTRSSLRIVPMFPAVERAMVEQHGAEARAGRGLDTDFVFCTRSGHSARAAQRGPARSRGGREGGRPRPRDSSGSAPIVLLTRRSARGGPRAGSAAHGPFPRYMDEALRLELRQGTKGRGTSPHAHAWLRSGRHRPVARHG